MKRVFLGLSAAFLLAGFSPYSVEAQVGPCDDCNTSGPWAVCVIGGDGNYEGCHTTDPMGCKRTGFCWAFQEQQAVDLTGTAVDPNKDYTAILTAGPRKRPCDSAITAWALSRLEATQHRRKLRTLVV